MEKNFTICSYSVFHKLTVLMIALEFYLLTNLLLLSIKGPWKVNKEKLTYFCLFKTQRSDISLWNSCNY